MMTAGRPSRNRTAIPKDDLSINTFYKQLITKQKNLGLSNLLPLDQTSVQSPIWLLSQMHHHRRNCKKKEIVTVSLDNPFPDLFGIVTNHSAKGIRKWGIMRNSWAQLAKKGLWESRVTNSIKTCPRNSY